MPNAPAARINDKIQHTQAQSYRTKGMAVGMVIGVVIGTGLVIAAAAAAEFFSFGLATPLVAVAVAATVAVAETAVIGGTGLATGAAISDSAADRGRKHREDDGIILTGIPTIFVGGKDLMVASCGSKATCKRHKHSPPITVEIVAQGSASVLLGPDRDPAARVNDQVTCQAMIGTGCTTVIIGGATATCYKIDGQGDDPDQERFDKLGKYGGYAALIGGAVLAVPAGVAGGGIMAGLRAGAWVLGKGLAIMGGTSYALDHWVHNEQTRHDIASALAIFMPFADHAAGAAKGAFRGGRGGGSSSGGGDTGGSGDAGGGGSTGGGDTPTGGGGDTPPTAANDNNAGVGKPPEPANDNNAGGTPMAPGETVQQFGSRDGGSPGDVPPDDALDGSRPPAPANDNTPGGGKPPTPANDNTPGVGKPPTPANDNTPGKTGETGDTAETGKGGETTEQTGSSDGGAPGKAPPDQAEDGTGAAKGDKAAGAGEGDPTVQTKDSPGGEDDAADKSDAEKAPETPEQQRARLESEVQKRVDEVKAQGLSRNERGPCQSGVMDTRTGKTFFSRNTLVAPENLHPVLKARLDAYLERTGGVTPDRAGKLEADFGAGAHSEINAMNEAFQAREAANIPVTDASFNEFLIHNISLGRGAQFGTIMPRCANCFDITQGAQVTPSVHSAEVGFYNKEYGPDFMDNVARLHPGSGGSQ